jgi:folate-binding protein YgfZ
MDVAFFDRTARGRLIVTGRDRVDLIDRLATNRVVGVAEGQGVATCFCTAKGRMIDWTVVLNRGSDLLLLSANPERLSGHIQQFTITEDVTVRNYMAIEIVVCGSGAAELLGVQVEPWAFADTVLGEVKVQIVRVEPLMGEAYAVLAPDAVALRRVLEDRGRRLHPGDVDEIRVRQGIPAFPAEINERHNPWEAGLDDAISLTKGCYIGQEVIARLNTYEKVRRKLVRLRVDRPMERGEEVTREGEGVGRLTTVVEGGALAYLDVDLAAPGTTLDGAAVVAFES